MKATRYAKELSKGLFWLISLGLLLALALPSNGTGIAQASPDPGWYDAEWAYRRAITIDHNKVEDAAPYTDFPVLVYATELSNIKADGADIRFTSSVGTELPREIESYSSASGTLWAWVKVTLTKDSSDEEDDVIYMYYGNAAATEPPPDSTYGSEKVWDSNYKAVWHLDEDAAGTATDDLYQDSTLNDYDGDDRVSDAGKTGKIGSGQHFDGSDDYIDTNTNILPGGAYPFTVSLWYKWPYNGVSTEKGDVFSEVTASKDGLFDWQAETKNTPLTKVKWVVYSWDSDRGRMQENKVEFQSAAGADNAWYYFVGTYDGDSEGDIELYVNGVSTGTDTLDVNSPVPWATDEDDDVAFGETSAKGWYGGLLDEVRISDTARSAQWITTEYNNQSDPTAFCSVGEEESRFVTAIEIRGQNYTSAVSVITFPEGAPGATVSTPYNNADGDGSPQGFGDAGTAKPVVTLVNTAAVAYTVWYNIEAFSEGVVSSENYVIIAKGGACANAAAITETATLDGSDHVCTGTITTIAATGDGGEADKRDLYLKITLSALAGKTGTSTLTILGEST